MATYNSNIISRAVTFRQLIDRKVENNGLHTLFMTSNHLSLHSCAEYEPNLTLSQSSFSINVEYFAESFLGRHFAKLLIKTFKSSVVQPRVAFKLIALVSADKEFQHLISFSVNLNKRKFSTNFETKRIFCFKNFLYKKFG